MWSGILCSRACPRSPECEQLILSRAELPPALPAVPVRARPGRRAWRLRIRRPRPRARRPRRAASRRSSPPRPPDPPAGRGWTALFPSDRACAAQRRRRVSRCQSAAAQQEGGRAVRGPGRGTCRRRRRRASRRRTPPPPSGTWRRRAAPGPPSRRAAWEALGRTAELVRVLKQPVGRWRWRWRCRCGARRGLTKAFWPSECTGRGARSGLLVAGAAASTPIRLGFSDPD